MPDYKVTVNPGGKPRMIRASNRRSAANHAVRGAVTVEDLTTEDIIALSKDGATLEIAGEDAPEAAEQQQDGGQSAPPPAA